MRDVTLGVQHPLDVNFTFRFPVHSKGPATLGPRAHILSSVQRTTVSSRCSTARAYDVPPRSSDSPLCSTPTTVHLVPRFRLSQLTPLPAPRPSRQTPLCGIRAWMLLRTSGDGGDDEDHDGWEDNLHVSGGGWSRGFLRGPLGSSLRQDDEEEDEVGEEGQEECKDEGRRRRQQQQQLRRRFFVGQWLDVKDTVNNWLEATVIDMSSSGGKTTVVVRKM